MHNQYASAKGIGAIIIASFLWGTTGTAAHYALNVSALGIGAFSTGVGGLLLLIMARKYLYRDHRLLLKHVGVFLFGAIAVAIYPLAFYSSMRLSGIAIGTVVSIASAPLFAAILDKLISNKPISLHWLLSFLMGAVGITLLVLGKGQPLAHIDSSEQQRLGVLLGCIAGFSYASYSWAAKHLMEKGVHSRSAMSGLFGGAALLLLPSLYFTGENLFANVTNMSVSFYIAIIPMLGRYLLFAFGLNFVDASKATLITVIEPLIATLFAVYIIGEAFSMLGWAGAGLVFVCLLMQAYGVRR